MKNISNKNDKHKRSKTNMYETCVRCKPYDRTKLLTVD